MKQKLPSFFLVVFLLVSLVALPTTALANGFSSGTLVVGPSTNPSDVYLLGDVNNDGSITALDALDVLKISVEKLFPTPMERKAADVNKDDQLNAQDALEILKKSVNKESCF